MDDSISISIVSRNDTASDIPGAGRTLGKAYALAGRKLERLLGSVAQSMGRGPAKTAERVWLLCNRVDLEELPELKKKFNKGCKALLCYTKCVARSVPRR